MKYYLQCVVNWLFGGSHRLNSTTELFRQLMPVSGKPFDLLSKIEAKQKVAKPLFVKKKGVLRIREMK